MEQSTKTWLLIYLGWFLLMGTATFLYFQFYPVLHSYDASHGLWHMLGVLNLVIGLGWKVAWLWWLCSMLILLFGPTVRSILYAKLHFALFLILPVADLLTLREDTSTPFSGLDVVELQIALIMLLLEFVLVGIGCMRLKLSPLQHIGPPLLMTGILVALLGGWFAGILSYSAMLPDRIIQEAEKLAQGRAYCLDTRNGALKRRFDLAGIKTRAGRFGPWLHDPSALLVIEDNDKRVLRYWSYYRDAFVNNATDKRDGPPRYDPQYILCTPMPHYAANLEFWPGGHDFLMNLLR